MIIDVNYTEVINYLMVFFSITAPIALIINVTTSLIGIFLDFVGGKHVRT